MKKAWGVVALLALLCGVAWASVTCEGDTCTAPKVRIGIVGAGISGASVAHFVRQGMPLADIHVFERENFVGGRIRSADIEGQRVEHGASIYHVSNRYFDNFVREFGLARKEPPNLSKWGIWNGQEFVMQESEWLVLTLAKMLYRYGLSPFRVESLAGHTKDRWTEVYTKLKNNSYETSESFLNALELSDLVQKSLLKVLQEGGVGEEYIHELVTAIERVNYGQSTAMNAFAGFVGLVGSGKGTLFSVEGGNYQVVEKLLEAAKVKLRLSSEVTAISSVGHDIPEYTIKYLKGGNEFEESYDAVVIATPLEFTSISFDLGDERVNGADGLPQAAGKRRPYQMTHATLVVSSGVKRSFFGLPDDAWLPGFILTTENPHIPFNSASVIRKLNETHNIFKVFSRKELSDDTLDRLFIDRTTTVRMPWQAYPVLTPYPLNEWPRILLRDKLYYANAFESAVSCIETQIASGHNVANLLIRDF